MSRASRGSVGIEEKQGKWRLRLPRSVAKDSQRYISTGLDATPENLRRVQIKAWQIEEDIRSGLLDISLERYKPQIAAREARSLPDLQQLWQKYCEYKKPQLSPITFEQDFLRRYGVFIDRLPTKAIADAMTIRGYTIANLSAPSAKRMLVQINACCKWALKSGLIDENPFVEMPGSLRVPRYDPNRIDPFTKSERDAIIQAFSEHPLHCHYTNFVKFLFMTGCRTGEAIGLQWQHINSDCSEITFCQSYSSKYKVRKTTKTNKVRRFPCNQPLLALLLIIRPTHYQPNALVFTSEKGNPIDTDTFLQDIWRGRSKGKGIVLKLIREGKVDRYRSPYSTRHTFITLALEAGLTVSQVANLVGNSPEVILNHYAGNLLKLEVPVF